MRHVVYDTNDWKSLVHGRLAVSLGDRGCLSIFGDSLELHRLLSEHLTSECRAKTEGAGGPLTNGRFVPNGATTTGLTAWLDAPQRRRFRGRCWRGPAARFSRPSLSGSVLPSCNGGGKRDERGQEVGRP